jgi:glyoxylase-like metal-dependent hydrolase (beta-lactamase superfamily II)
VTPGHKLSRYAGRVLGRSRDEEEAPGVGNKNTVTASKAQGHTATYLLTGISAVLAAAGLVWFLISDHQRTNKNMQLIRLVVGPLQVNCFIVADDKTKEAVVIDPGDDAPELLRIIKEKELRVKYIVNTHGHFDHIGANRALKEATGAEILIHEGDAPVLASAPRQSAAFGMNSVSSPPADRYVKHGDIISAGEVSLKVLHTPGHSPGGISLLEQGMVFTGDALFSGSIGRTDFPGGDLLTLIRSIKTNLLSLPDETRVFSGHGAASTIGDERRENPFLNKDSGFE